MKKGLDLILMGGALLLVIMMLILLCAPGLNFFGKYGDPAGRAALADLINPDGGKALGGSVAALLFTLFGLGAAGCLVVLKHLNKDVKWASFVALGGAICLFIAALMFFCTRAFYFAQVARTNDMTVKAVKEGMADKVKLGGGAIVNGLFALFAAASLGFKGVMGLVKVKE